MHNILKILLFIILATPTAYAAEPVATDSRIKTLVYNENEVFPVTIHFGYQSYIEFAKGEEIQAISLGDPFPWRITPSGNRLFIKPIDGYAHTNMTVITSRHTYQFDLQSKLPPEEPDAELTYAVRFFYPDNSFDRLRITGTANESAIEFPMPAQANYNFNYSLVGPHSISPVKVFDDGESTYFEFPFNGGAAPSIALLEFNNAETPLTTYKQGNFIVVDKIAGQFTLRLGNEIVCVFNENNY